MPFELIGAVGAVMLLLSVVWLRGGHDARRAVSVMALLVLGAVTSAVILVKPSAHPALLGASPAPATALSTPSVTASAVGSGEFVVPSVPATVLRHEIQLGAGTYTIFMVDDGGITTSQRTLRFDGPSIAPVDRVDAPNGLVHWRTVVGGYAGWSYIADASGPIVVREVLRWPDGKITYRPIDAGP